MNSLIDALALAPRLGDPGLVVLDARFRLADPGEGRRLWAAGHIPGAIHADLDRDLSSPVTVSSGRHPLPAPEDLARTLSAWGIGPGIRVVVYDDAAGGIAGRAWWLLRWMGHDDVAVLDGGLPAWTAAGGRVESAPSTARPRVFEGQPDPARVVGATEVLEGMREGSMVLVDVREEARFAGRAEPIDSVAGHVPGAVNLPWVGNLGPDGRFLPPDVLAKRYEPVAGLSPVFMCGSGVTACHGLLAMAHAGLGGGRLYAGSWSEWIRDPSRPVVPKTG